MAAPEPFLIRGFATRMPYPLILSWWSANDKYSSPDMNKQLAGAGCSLLQSQRPFRNCLLTRFSYPVHNQNINAKVT